MTRVNVALLLALLASSLYLVSVQYESRRLYYELDRAHSQARRLASDRDALQVQKRSQATPLRVERLAKEKLQMRQATPNITHYVTYQAESVATAASAQADAAPPALIARRSLP